MMIHIPLETPSKKNSRVVDRRTGRTFPNKRYTEWHKAAALYVRQQNAHPLSRKLGDQLLREGLIYSKMPKYKANAVYISVRLFGDWAYGQDDALTSSNSKLFTFHWAA